MIMFRKFYFSNISVGPDSPHVPFSPWASLIFGSIRFLITLALFFIGVATLILLFPKVLAYFVAGMFLIAAFICLRSAWRVYWRSRPPFPDL